MINPSLQDILLCYAMGVIVYFAYRWTKQHGPVEWERKMAPAHFVTRKAVLFMVALLAFLAGFIFSVMYVIDVYG